jgi:hypothetical protein
MQDSTIRQNLDFVLVVLMGAGLLVFGLYMAIHYPHVTVRYDCSISEISPDYPIEVKEACRKLRAENILNKPK